MNVSSMPHRDHCQSLRTQLIAAITATTLIVLVATTAILYSLIRQNLYAQFDELLGAKARALATMVEQEGERIDIEFAEHQLQEFARQERPEYYQVWSDDGTVIARSRRLRSADLPKLQGSRIAPGVKSWTLPDGRSGRIAGMQFLPRVDGERLESVSPIAEENDTEGEGDNDGIDYRRRKPVTLVVAHETAETDHVLANIFWLMCGSTAVACGLIVGVLGFVVTRRLLPVEELTRQIGQLREESLSDRIAVAKLPRELQPVVKRLNGLIARLQIAFEREKTFTADMAHELRTPLAGIRTTLEVCLGQERDGVTYREAIQRTLRICGETEQIVGSLLALTRIESGREYVDYACVDVGYVLRDCWRSYADKAADRQLQVKWDIEADVILNTDPTMFRLVVKNLFDNAVTYADPGGDLTIATQLTEEQYRLRMTNSGCRLTEAEASSVFERFWRADKSRSATGLHAGLGLALCRRMLKVLGGQIAVAVRNQRFEAVVSFNSERTDSASAVDESGDPATKMRTLSSTIA